MITRKAVIIEENLDPESQRILISLAYDGKIYIDSPLGLTENKVLMAHLDSPNACRLGFWAGVEFEQRVGNAGQQQIIANDDFCAHDLCQPDCALKRRTPAPLGVRRTCAEDAQRGVGSETF